MSEWIKDRNPDKDGDYLCITSVVCKTRSKTGALKSSVAGVIYFRRFLHFASDLYKIDPYVFYKYQYKRKDQRGGWYDLDSDGYYEITNVYAWMELPEMPEECKN